MNKKHYIIPIFVPHRGCPHNCVFCNQKKITGTEGSITGKDVERIIDEYLSTINPDNSGVEVSFFGGSFTAIPIDYQTELLKVAYEALKSGKVDSIRLSTRPDCITDEILQNLKKYGASIIELGVQSMDEEVLRVSERGHTSQDVVNATKLIRQYGFTLGHQMMVGLPCDNKQKDIFTASEIIKLHPDFVRIYPALTIKDTPMEDMYREGVYTPVSLDDATLICKELYEMFIKNDIDIIRIGLQPTDKINVGGDVVAGPFHPSFREHVESIIVNEMIEYIIQNYFKECKNVAVTVNPKMISKVYANKKCYFKKMKNKLSTINILIQQSNSTDMEEICINGDDRAVNMSIKQYIKTVK